MFRILLATDGTEERVRKQMAAIADLPSVSKDVTVTVLHVFREVHGDQGGTFDMRDYSGTPDAVTAAIEFFEERDIDVEAASATGDPGEEILRVAREIEADQIVVGGRKRSPVGKAVFGSVTQDVILGADRPVLVVGDAASEE